MKLPYPIKHFLATLLIGPCIPALLLNMVAIASLTIALKLIGGSYIPTATISYSIAVIISSLFFKLQRPQNTEAIEDQS